jgi:hypothetical protein
MGGSSEWEGRRGDGVKQIGGSYELDRRRELDGEFIGRRRRNQLGGKVGVEVNDRRLSVRSCLSDPLRTSRSAPRRNGIFRCRSPPKLNLFFFLSYRLFGV